MIVSIFIGLLTGSVVYLWLELRHLKAITEINSKIVNANIALILRRLL